MPPARVSGPRCLREDSRRSRLTRFRVWIVEVAAREDRLRGLALQQVPRVQGAEDDGLSRCGIRQCQRIEATRATMEELACLRLRSIAGSWGDARTTCTTGRCSPAARSRVGKHGTSTVSVRVSPDGVRSRDQEKESGLPVSWSWWWRRWEPQTCGSCRRWRTGWSWRPARRTSTWFQIFIDAIHKGENGTSEGVMWFIDEEGKGRGGGGHIHSQ